jgi:hypothetical protein
LRHRFSSLPGLDFITKLKVLKICIYAALARIQALAYPAYYHPQKLSINSFQTCGLKYE